MTDEGTLLPLQDAPIDGDTLTDLFLDLSSVASVISVRVRGRNARFAAEGSVTLGNAYAALLAGDVGAVQVHYRHAGRLWCDTIMRQQESFRIVRAEQPNAA